MWIPLSIWTSVAATSPSDPLSLPDESPLLCYCVHGGVLGLVIYTALYAYVADVLEDARDAFEIQGTGCVSSRFSCSSKTIRRGGYQGRCTVGVILRNFVVRYRIILASDRRFDAIRYKHEVLFTNYNGSSESRFSFRFNWSKSKKTSRFSLASLDFGAFASCGDSGIITSTSLMAFRNTGDARVVVSGTFTEGWTSRRVVHSRRYSKHGQGERYEDGTP